MSLTVHYRVRFRDPRLHMRSLRKLARVLPPTAATATQTARSLALGHKLALAVQRGEVASYAEAGRRLGVSGVRINHLVRLTLLAPDIQERVLTGELGLSARELYRISGMPSWVAQREEVRKASAGAE